MNDAFRYVFAANHFSHQLNPCEKEVYFELLSKRIDTGSPLNVSEDDREYVITHNVNDPFFKKCMIAKENTVSHAGLRRGPDEKEIADRVNAKQPRDFDDVFATIDRKRYYFHPDRPAVRTVDALGAGLDKDLDDAINVAKEVALKDAGPDATMKDDDVSVPIAYMRNTRQDGLQIIVNLGTVVNKTENGEFKRSNLRRIVTVTKGFNKLCETDFLRPREMVRINVLLAYSSRPYRLEAFLKMFAGYFKSSNTDLVRIVVSTTEKERAEVERVGGQHEELTDARFLVITSKGDEFGNFSRAVAMREAVKTVPEDEVIFFSDADLIIGGNFLQNCRVNIMRKHQVWFPVMFSLFPYGKSLSSRDGIWRRSSYGMACMYASDFLAVKGFGGDEEKAFTGWGSEDVFLYNRFRDDPDYAVLRTLEPGLQHQWHAKDCEHNEHYDNCMRTNYMTIGSQEVIAKLMAEKRVNVSSLTKDAVPV